MPSGEGSTAQPTGLGQSSGRCRRTSPRRWGSRASRQLCSCPSHVRKRLCPSRDLGSPICAIRLWTGRGLRALGTLACLMYGGGHAPVLSLPPCFCPGPAPPPPAGGPAHRGPAACCRMGRWTQTPPAGGRPGAAETPASLQTLFAVTLTVVKTSPSIQALQAPHADGLFPH